jgi:DNA-binding NtrC family response regulator
MEILVVDDDPSVRRVLQFKLQQRGYVVTALESSHAALERLGKTPYDLLLSDVRMPGMDGIELLERAKILHPAMKVILITAHANIPQAVHAVKLGAFDYLTKPFDDEELFLTIDKALEFQTLEQENRRLRGRLQREERSGKLVGVSDAYRRMMDLVRKVADSDATVLLTGESGTGKELVANTIHGLSRRGDRDLITVNCAAIPRDLLESELFGHVRGAFTGAARDKKGKFELADRSTLLLDEVAELAVDLQAKLLRVLQNRTIEPVGAEYHKEIDVRVIAATNANLQQRVLNGSFREDLFYRLNVVPIRVPSLRERREDIPLLVEHIVRRAIKGHTVEINPKLMDALLSYSWPGNIRELENVIDRMVILRRSDRLSAKDLPQDFGAFNPREGGPAESQTEPPSLPLRDEERRLITDALRKSGWNRSRAARLLKIPRHVLIYRIKKYSIREENP